MSLLSRMQEVDRLNSWAYKVEQAERNKALNAAWDELVELCPGSAEFHPHLPETPNCGMIVLM